MRKTHRLTTPLLALLLASCGSREEGARLHLGLAHLAARSAEAEGTTRHFTNDQGDHITLSRAHVTLSSVEISPCPASAARRWLREFAPIGTAHAHSESSPLRLGTPHVNSLDRPDGEPLALDTLRPPPGRYCRVHLIFGPADADAEGLPGDGTMEGRTLILEGAVIPAGGGDSRPFRLESAGVAHAELSFDGLTLSPEELESHQLITLAYDRWLDGSSPLAPDAATRALQNISRSAALTPSP
ncbi:MAG: hypothetical protein JXB05_24045 [Myxococcaceae bacterium]|nr:hypothetical protein [Myxococcaceae bacterium]